MSYTLRPYQTEAVESTITMLAKGEHPLLVLATGLGKTVCFSEVANRMRSGRIMVLAHRTELIEQAAQKIADITGVVPAIEQAERRADVSRFWGKCPFIVASEQTMRRRRDRFDWTEFAGLIIDEAHRSMAKEYRKTIEHAKKANPDLWVMGVTATADRFDRQGLKSIFTATSYQYGIAEGINDGWLARIHQRAIQVKDLDFSGIKSRAGELDGKQLDAMLEREHLIHGMVLTALDIAAGRRMLCFCKSVYQAEMAVEIANRYKPDSARLITGTTPADERKATLRAYANGDFQSLFNVGVLTEGYDEPGIRVVAIMRPTLSRSLYVQMAGRGTRTLPGIVDAYNTPEDRKAAIAASDKPYVDLIDFCGNAGTHKLIHPADILGHELSDKVRDRVQEKAVAAEQAGVAFDVSTAITDAQAEITAEELAEIEEARRQRELDKQREIERRRGLTGSVDYQARFIDPFDQLDVSAAPAKTSDPKRPITPGQLGLLNKYGVNDASKLTYVEAHQLINKLIERRKNNLCSFKAAMTLAQLGLNADVSEMKALSMIHEAQQPIDF